MINKNDSKEKIAYLIKKDYFFFELRTLSAKEIEELLKTEGYYRNENS